MIQKFEIPDKLQIPMLTKRTQKGLPNKESYLECVTEPNQRDLSMIPYQQGIGSLLYLQNGTRPLA